MMIVLVIGIIFLEVFADLYSKHKVKNDYQKLSKTGETNTSPVFNDSWIKIRRPVMNPGAFLGLLKKKQRVLHVMTSGTMLLMLVCIVFFIKEKDWTAVPLAMVLGGGLGNFFERITKGCVTDFLQTKLIKNVVFNLADLFILIGSVLLMVCIFI